MPSPRILTVDSNVDTVTSLGLSFREPNLYALINPPIARLERRQGTLAVRSAVFPVTSGVDLNMIMGVGHGTTNTFYGQDGQQVFQVGAFDLREVQGRSIHLTACSAGARLGPSFVRAGAKFFVGYVQDVLFPVELANYVFDADCEIDRGLIDGQTAGASQQRAIERYDHYIRAFNAQGKGYLAQWLKYNRDILRGPLDDPAFGSASATLR